VAPPEKMRRFTKRWEERPPEPVPSILDPEYVEYLKRTLQDFTLRRTMMEIQAVQRESWIRRRKIR